MSDNDDKPKKPLGQNLRDLINPALEDSRKPKLQLDKLDLIFTKFAEILPTKLEEEFRFFASHVDSVEKRAPEKKTPVVIDAITASDGKGGSSYEAVKKFQLPISTTFTEFSAQDIKDLPGYVKLHEMARDLDIAIKLVGVTQDETKGNIYSQPLLILDISKSYQEGAMESPTLYPNLPTRPARFERRPGQFDL